jgi:glycosyltransferase involved in cell wall biosynthesis
MSLPFVSIVMCSYNEDIFLEEAINAALSQEYKNFELLISDDASGNTKTIDILNKYKDYEKVRVIFNKENRGYLKNKNFAISQAKGEFITQLDNDDLCDIDKLSLQINVLKNNPDIKVVGCGYKRIDFNGKIIDEFETKEDIIIDKLPPQNQYPFWFPSLMFHRNIINEGLFNEYFEGTMGDDLYWTIHLNKKYKIYQIGKALYSYRFNPNSITNVLNNDRKIIMPLVLKELIHQQMTSGKDWLEYQDFNSIRQFELQLKNNNKLMSEQYVIWAAKAIDKWDFLFARKLMKKAFLLNPFNSKLLRTLFYYIKRKSRILS